MAATIRMSKGKKAKNEKDSKGQAKLGGKQYERELATLHGELVKLQFWMVAKGLKVCVVIRRPRRRRQGRRDQGDHRAGQSARLSRRRATGADRTRKVANVYSALHAAFSGWRRDRDLDRSWYNRAGVERVMEFCSMEQVRRFLEVAPEFEKAIVESGIL